MSDDYQIVKVGIVGEPIILKLEKMDNESVKIEIAIVGVKDGEINLKAEDRDGHKGGLLIHWRGC